MSELQHLAINNSTNKLTVTFVDGQRAYKHYDQALLRIGIIQTLPQKFSLVPFPLLKSMTKNNKPS